MTLDQALAFLLFAVVAAITPGPSNVMLTATGAVAGVRRGLGCLAGVALGAGGLMLAVAGGFGAALADAPAILAAMRWLGIGFLLWLAWKIAWSSPGGAAPSPKPVGFLAAALFQWINPKVWMVSAGAVAAYMHPAPGGTLRQALAIAGLFVAAALPSGFVWLAFGASMQRLLRRPRAVRAFNLSLAAALVASIALLL